MRRSLLAVAVCGLSAGAAFVPSLGAQAPPPDPNPLPTFEVAAVRLAPWTTVAAAWKSPVCSAVEADNPPF